MGRGYSEACHSRIPEHAWHRPARHCFHIDPDVIHDGPRSAAHGRWVPLGRETPEGGHTSPSRPKREPAPRSRLAIFLEGDAPLRRQDAVRLQQSPAGRRYCSHAYLDEAHVTKIEQQ